MNNRLQLQQIIGVDKKNPHFTICRNSLDPGKLYVFFGAALMEIVSEDKTNPDFKLLVARLYNAGINAIVLIKAFVIARTTIKRWGEALKSNDPETLIRVLSGPGAPRKLTPDIIAFITLRFYHIYNETHYNYSVRIRSEIKEVFNKDISAETVRPLFKQLKQKVSDTNEGLVTQKRADSCDFAPEDEQIKEDNCNTNCPDIAHNDTRDNRKYSITFQEKEQRFLCHHVGVLLFIPLIASLLHSLKGKATIVIQWLVTILLGALNIEQTKLVDPDSIQALFGSFRKSLHLQRSFLWEIASEEMLKRILMFNAKLVDVSTCRDFYYDPHTKHYTGIQKILKGWCSNVKGAGKVLNMDFIHTSKGNPVFIKHVDNFHDLRERFTETVNEFRTLMEYSQASIITFVVDRGIYSFKVFENILQSNNIHLITWQKGYKRNLWDDTKVSGSFIMTRTRNHSNDLLMYGFKYSEQPWDRNQKMRQIIVRATNPKSVTIEVSILTTDMDRDAGQIIRLMFKRWIQENDFKYLIKHFGINEITSYASTSYRKLQKLVEDKQMTSGVYKALMSEYNHVKRKLGSVLVQAHTSKTKNRKHQEKIEMFTEQANTIQEQLNETKKKVSRLDTVIEEQYCRLNTQNKALMDSVKIIARNMFYQTLQPFRELYDNYRDDHTIFRNLTRSHGLVLYGDDTVEIELFPTTSYPLKTRKVVEAFLEIMNQKKPVMPDDSGRRIVFKLGKKVNKLFAISL